MSPWTGRRLTSWGPPRVSRAVVGESLRLSACLCSVSRVITPPLDDRVPYYSELPFTKMLIGPIHASRSGRTLEPPAALEDGMAFPRQRRAA